MRALIRMRLLAAVCALLLMFASNAHAGAPIRPIDRPDGGPEPGPVLVGDPDEPGGLIPIPINVFGRVYVIRIAMLNTGRNRSGRRIVVPTIPRTPGARKGAHAR
jgi:hypothetical protein